MTRTAASPHAPGMATLTAAILLALHGFAPSAAAQDTASDDDRSQAKELDAVVVTYRASLQAAIDTKRAERGQVDAIVAEDIGKFPDLNLAESLQRIPGVAITRDAGEGRNVSVRGLGPDFTRVRINGMEALTTTGGTDSSGGANRGRGFDFNVFASDLFNSIIVRKTAQAAVEEGSLGATVDLHTARPFDFDGFTAVASAQASYNDLSEKTNPRAAALISNTWADGTMGALLSVAYTDRSLIEQGHSTVRWDSGSSSGGFSPNSPFQVPNNAFHPRLPRYGVLEHDQERLGVTASLQFEPSEYTRLSIDGLYASFDATRSENFLQVLSLSRTGAGKPQMIVRDGAVDSRNNLVYAVFDNVDLRSEARFDELETTFQQFTLNFEHEFNDDLRMNALVGWAGSEHDNPIQTTITLDRVDSNNFVYDYRGNDRQPLLDYGFDVTNPANWTFANGLSEIRLRPQAVDNDFQTVQFDLAWDVNAHLTLKGGLNWKEYEFKSAESRRASELAVPALPAGVTLAELTRIYGTSGLRAPAGTPTSWLIPNISAFNRIFGIYSNEGIFTVSNSVASVRGNNRSVKEEVGGVWLQADFQTELFGRPLLGDFGFRHIETDQSSTGFALVNGQQVLLNVKRDYSDTLPAMNLMWEVSDDFLIRFGAADVVARPGLGNLTPGVSVSVSGGARTVAGGDPFLKPFEARTYDLGFEWYFAEQSLLSFALFRKEIDSFVQTSRETRPFNTSGLPESLLAGTGALPTDDFQFNIPVNTPGGDLDGAELSWQQPFHFLPEPFNNFGAIFNYTWVDSKIQYVTSTGAASLRTDLTGLSKNAYNATLYFDNGTFSARVSMAYRDDYLTTVPGRNGADVEGTKGTRHVDFAASYKFNPNWEFTFEGINLTDEINDQYVDSNGDRVSVAHYTGRQYLLGVRYRY